MFRGDIENNISNDKKEENLNSKIIFLGILMAVLAVLRIVSLEILALLSDGLGVLMVYFFFQSKNRCMAIFLMFNGVLGFIIGISRASMTYSMAKMTWFNFYNVLLFGIAFYALIVYLYECYIAYIGITTYGWDNGLGFPGITGSQRGGNSSNFTYNTLPTSEPNKPNFVAFAGKGTTLG